MSKEEATPVCQFGNTEYDSRLLDNIYRCYGDEQGGTVLCAYWKCEPKSFKAQVPYMIIEGLLKAKEIGSLCEYYDWKEVELDGSPKTDQFNMDAWMKSRNEGVYMVLPSKMECMKIASTLPHANYEELVATTEKIVRYLERPL